MSPQALGIQIKQVQMPCMLQIKIFAYVYNLLYLQYFIQTYLFVPYNMFDLPLI